MQERNSAQKPLLVDLSMLVNCRCFQPDRACKSTFVLAGKQAGKIDLPLARLKKQALLARGMAHQ